MTCWGIWCKATKLYPNVTKLSNLTVTTQNPIQVVKKKSGKMIDENTTNHPLPLFIYKYPTT